MTDVPGERPSSGGMHRWTSWVLVCGQVVAGCGGRTLVESEPDGDANPMANENGPSSSGASSGHPDGSAPPGPGSTVADAGSEPPFFVCPFDPPALQVVCDTPGLVCVYQGFGSCRSYECGATGWQAGHEGC
jgi:hypothetical protein